MEPEGKMKFVSTKMSLPLFMVSRNRLKYNVLDKVRNNITKGAAHYTRDCVKENATDTATFAYNRHITGLETVPKYPYPVKCPLKVDRSLGVSNDWQMAPNRYGCLKEPFADIIGSKGAVFAKVHKTVSAVPRKKTPWKFYSKPGCIETLLQPNNQHKGVFLSNARDHRASTRFMVSSPLTCYRDPNFPSPIDHYTKMFEINYKYGKKKTSPKPNPHLFNRLTCVPSIPRPFLARKNVGFEPGAGQYDISAVNACPCNPKKIYMPGLQLWIDKQKRLKFRRLPYTKVTKRLYCTPDWSHVPGKGHRHVFKKHKKKGAPKLKKPQELKKSEKQLKLYADAKYLYMLTSPIRHSVSTRHEPVPSYVPKIFFNSIAKRVVRKQLRMNKKIAFNSGQDRWKDSDRPLPLTTRQLEQIKKSLPEDRRLVDHPVLVRRKSQIESRLFEVPDHHKAKYMPSLRKRLFKFLPLPAAKVLVTDSDIRPDIHFDHHNPTGFFHKKFDERQYFRDSILNPVQAQKVEEIEVEPDESLHSPRVTGPDGAPLPTATTDEPKENEATEVKKVSTV